MLNCHKTCNIHCMLHVQLIFFLPFSGSIGQHDKYLCSKSASTCCVDVEVDVSKTVFAILGFVNIHSKPHVNPDMMKFKSLGHSCTNRCRKYHTRMGLKAVKTLDNTFPIMQTPNIQFFPVRTTLITRLPSVYLKGFPSVILKYCK